MNIEEIKEYLKNGNEIIDLPLETLAQIIENIGEPKSPAQLNLLTTVQHAYIYKCNETKMYVLKQLKLTQMLLSFKEIQKGLEEKASRIQEELDNVSYFLMGISGDARYIQRAFEQEITMYDLKDLELKNIGLSHAKCLLEIEATKQVIKQLQERLDDLEVKKDVIKEVLIAEIQKQNKRVHTLVASYYPSNATTKSYRLKKGITVENLPEKYIKTKVTQTANMDLIKKNYETDEALKEVVEVIEKKEGVKIKKNL